MEPNDDNYNNPFENEFNEESSNPLSAEYKESQISKTKSDDNSNFNPYEDKNNNNSNQDENNNKINNQNPYENSNNNKINNFNEQNNNSKINNPYENNNKNSNDEDYNPYGDDNNNPGNYNNNDNPYEENNPFETNNENNPFENNFEENDFNNNPNPNNFNNNFQNENTQKLPSFDNFEGNTLNPYLNKGNNNNNYNNMNNNLGNGGGNNYQNNFGGPSESPNKGYPPNPFNPFGNNPQNNNNKGINNNNNPNDSKRIKAILDTCIALYHQSSQQYENFNIKEAMKSLCKSIKGLDGLKQTILNKKTSFTSLIPKITSLRNKAFSNLQEYRINIYLIIGLKFRPAPYDQVEPLLEFAKRYILTEPFVSFDDVFDPALDENKKLKFVMNDYFKKAQRLGYKNLLLYGPRGSGKTLAVHALAYDLKAKVAQIEGIELFKIPYFSKEFVKAAFSFMQNKPLIVYLKNIEQMFSNMNNFNFIYDRVSSSTLPNIIFIASTTELMQRLPKDVSKKFHYAHCIRPAAKNQKLNYIKFLSQKIGIKINLSEQELNNFAFENLINYSNEDIFNLIKTAIEIKRQQFGNDEENMVYKEGLNYNEIMNALQKVKGNLTPNEIKNYYL